MQTFLICKGRNDLEKVPYWEEGMGKNTVEGLQRTWRESENTNGMASQALHCLTVMTAAPLQALMKMTSNFLLTVLIVFSSLLNEFGWCLVCPQHFGLGMLWGLLNVKTPEWLLQHVLTQWTNIDNSLYAHVQWPQKTCRHLCKNVCILYQTKWYL